MESVNTKKTGRFIPTCVGNIVSVNIEAISNAVHPHVCGEHLFYCSCDSKRAGSSPRVWGTFELASEGGIQIRFIPTCVGNI